MSFLRNPTWSVALVLFIGVVASLGSQSATAGGAEQASKTEEECSVYGSWQSISRVDYDATFTVNESAITYPDGLKYVIRRDVKHPDYLDAPEGTVGYYGFPKDTKGSYPLFAMVFVESHRHWRCVLTFKDYRIATDGLIERESNVGSLSFKLK
ncbi:MAG: hypothetical protein ACPGOV_16690 [Magnetovibrionaceae bacterium]